MKHRDNLNRFACTTNDKEDWARFKQARNKINNRLRMEEKMWQKSRLNHCSNDSSSSWKCVKGILNWQSSGSPKMLFHDGLLRTKPLDIANIQNEYFIHKISTIRSNLPAPKGDPLSTLKSLMKNRDLSFSMKPVYPAQIEEIISKLKNTSSFGLDMIDTYAIKLAQKELLPAITHIVNLSIMSQKFPSSWKKSKVIPLHKKDDKMDPKNYRPVAIVPVLSKILEKAVFGQIMDYMTEKELINVNHHAYRPGHNTTIALIQM